MTRGTLLLISTVILFLVFVGYKRMAASTNTQPIPASAQDEPLAQHSSRETAVFAGGCFWGTQTVFQQVKGVISTTAGYTGGAAETATYSQVTTETTGHAESVEIVFDPSKITYGTILKVFFSVAHDPTTKDRQGPDWGHQYRSAIWFKDAEQEKIARAYIEQLTAAKTFNAPIVTEVSPLKAFYAAEDYHQDYVKNNPSNPYVLVNSVPKIEKLKKAYPDLLKKK